MVKCPLRPQTGQAERPLPRSAAPQTMRMRNHRGLDGRGTGTLVSFPVQPGGRTSMDPVKYLGYAERLVLMLSDYGSCRLGYTGGPRTADKAHVLGTAV